PTPSGETSPAGDDPGTGQAGSVAVAERQAVRRVPPLQISLLPILVPLVLIAFGAIAEAAGLESEVISFVGDPVFALFVGLVGAYLLARRTLGGEQTGKALSEGFSTTGQILLITGVGGSLGAV